MVSWLTLCYTQPVILHVLAGACAPMHVHWFQLVQQMRSRRTPYAAISLLKQEQIKQYYLSSAKNLCCLIYQLCIAFQWDASSG